MFDPAKPHLEPSMNNCICFWRLHFNIPIIKKPLMSWTKTSLVEKFDPGKSHHDPPLIPGNKGRGKDPILTA